MEELDRLYSRAREAGADAENIAKVTVKTLTREQLEAEYISLCGMVAYYSKLERDQIANPLRHFEKIRESFREANAEDLLQEEDLEQLARKFIRSREAILDLLSHTQLMLGEFTRPTEPDL
jgi:hypothetical protein